MSTKNSLTLIPTKTNEKKEYSDNDSNPSTYGRKSFLSIIFYFFNSPSKNLIAFAAKK
jgi:hypothetical protein